MIEVIALPSALLIRRKQGQNGIGTTSDVGWVNTQWVRCTLADLVVGSNKCQSDTEAINDFRGMENSWAVPTHLLQSEGVANDLSDTIVSDFPLESKRKLDVFEYVATNWAVHTYDNSWSYNRYYEVLRHGIIDFNL
ncbi:hypothetical protein AVEN_104007-1 [Araneus ventricosus]|uniref:Uncharacterized protein n=1 Tax=Araneus ventricosus TaxID=182803 RepID=A0A4Y2P437_ARAVE|nr:hypothetical protein AVEN_104007-1 [Araneus ventricosus]